MNTSKHRKAEIGKNTPRDDLLDNPNIGQSKGTESADGIELIEGENTVEGDIGNDTTPQGGVRAGQVGRTNN